MTLRFKTNCLKVSILIIWLLFGQAVMAQRNVKEYSIPSFKELSTLIDQQAKAFDKNTAVLVWTDTLVFKKETGADFTARTQAYIGDASSWLTAALVMAFVEEVKLSLDDKVSQYLPVFKKYGKNYITLRHCLTHQTGIEYDESKLKKLFARKKFASLEEEVNDYASKEIQTNPGTEMRYSPVGISIAGRVLEVIAKKKFDQLIQQRLFRPLGMRNTTFSTIDASAVNPANGARSTAEDYMKFLVMLLNKGKHKDQTVLSEASVNELLQGQQPVDRIKYAPKGAQNKPYALGSWVVEASNNGQPISFSSMSFGGTMPILDICRQYAVVFFVKDLADEPKADTYLNLKKTIDNMLPASRGKNCL